VSRGLQDFPSKTTYPLLVSQSRRLAALTRPAITVTTRQEMC
jgi:hypothetical protein